MSKEISMADEQTSAGVVLPDLIAELKKQADEIAREGHAGWGNTMLLAAEALSVAGVALPERMTCDDGYPSDDWLIANAHNRALDEVARLNPCRAQAVPDDLRAAAENCALVMRYIGSMGPDEIDGDNVELLFEDEDGRDIGADASIVEYAEKVADLLDAMLAAPSAKKESE